MEPTIITDRILFKKGRTIICYIDIMPQKIKVRTGKPSDSCCISWEYQPNELEKAKATATEFYNNCIRIWPTTTHEERTSPNGLPFLFVIPSKGKKSQQHNPTKKPQPTQRTGAKQSRQAKRQQHKKPKERSNLEKIWAFSLFTP